MTDCNAEEYLSNISDSSFVILGQGSLPSSVKDESLTKESDSIRNSSKISFLQGKVPDAVPQKNFNETFLLDDPQEKLQQLLQENYHLRETLSQNNLAIKSQLDTFIMWQQEVLKTHEAHKQKFLETKDMILKLRAENSNLKKQLEEGSQNFSNSNCADTFKSNDTVVTQMKSQIDSLQQQIKMLEENCKELNKKNEGANKENYRLKEKLKETETKVTAVKKNLEDALKENIMIKQMSDESSKKPAESFTYVSLPNSDARAQISNLFSQLEEERAKVSKLKAELQKIKNTEGSKLSTTEELTQYIDKLDDMNISFDRQNQRFNSIVSWVTLAEQNLNALKKDEISEGVDCLIMSEIEQLKTHLHQEENSFKQKQENLQEIHEQFTKLLADYKELQKKLSLLEDNSSNIQKFKEEVKNLTEQIKSKDEELLSVHKECDQLKEAVKKLNLECEEVAILRVQVQLYQTDFNDERAAREKLVGEKEEMAEQIRLLQTKIENLEKKEESTAKGQTSSAVSNGKKSRYVCPKCMFSFSDLDRCEKHIDECLNIHFYP